MGGIKRHPYLQQPCPLVAFWPVLVAQSIPKDREQLRRFSSAPQPASLQMCVATVRNQKLKKGSAKCSALDRLTNSLGGYIRVKPVYSTKRMVLLHVQRHKRSRSELVEAVLLPSRCASPALLPLAPLFFFIDGPGSAVKTAPFLWATCPATAPTGGFTRTLRRWLLRSSGATCWRKVEQRAYDFFFLPLSDVLEKPLLTINQ